VLVSSLPGVRRGAGRPGHQLRGGREIPERVLRIGVTQVGCQTRHHRRHVRAGAVPVQHGGNGETPPQIVQAGSASRRPADCHFQNQMAWYLRHKSDDVLTAIARLTRGNFRLLQRLLTRIQRVVQINDLATSHVGGGRGGQRRRSHRLTLRSISTPLNPQGTTPLDSESDISRAGPPRRDRPRREEQAASARCWPRATTHCVWRRRRRGPIPKGLHVDHVCEVTWCQRPDHLDEVTKAENTRRRPQRGAA
jgi:HNH endonuclease